MVNEFPKNPNAKALEDISDQKIYNHQIKEEKSEKILEDCLAEQDEQGRNTKLKKKKQESRK